MKKTVFPFFLLLLLFLTACNARSAESDVQQSTQPKAESVASQVDVSGLPEGQCYNQTPYLNPIGISYPEGQCVWNDKVYSFSNAPAKLGVTDANGNSEVLELPDVEYIYSVCETGDTLALLAGANPLFFAGTDDEQSAQASSDGGHAIYLYDETGNLTGSIPLTERCTDAPYELDSNGTDYFMLFSDAVVRVGDDGTQLAKSGDIGGRLLQLVCVDGAVFVRVEGDAIYQTEKIIRLDAQTLETETEFSCDGLDIQGMGKAEDGTLLLISGVYLLRPDFEAGKLTAILHLADNANTSVNNYRSVLETEHGFFAWNSDVEAACFYEKLPEGETLEDPTVITLFAGTGSYDIEIAAANFQKLYPQYRIDITAAESDEQTELALTELGAGKGYDMYLLYDTQWAQLDDAVFFEDLTRWMEADSAKPLERIRPSVLRQAQKNGGVYRLPVDYTILIYAADPELLSDNTPETVLRACEQDGIELYPFAFITDYSSQMAKRCAMDYVDAAQGTCNFQCDSFYAQLALLRRQQEALDTLPKNLDVAATCDGLLYYYVILSADSIVYQPGRYAYPELKQYVYYAYPSDYDSGCQLDFNSLLSINTKSEQKAGAWAFLSYLLSEAYQQSMNYLPVSDMVLQEQFAQLLAQEKITQEDIDTFYALVDHAQKPDYPTEPIEKIIQEEMAAYIDGAIEEKTTAERIQSRVSLYLMEQKVE
jgi:ABC-type glycerol-3-phosphate transport system substrate-binding protein